MFPIDSLAQKGGGADIYFILVRPTVLVSEVHQEFVISFMLPLIRQLFAKTVPCGGLSSLFPIQIHQVAR